MNPSNDRIENLDNLFRTIPSARYDDIFTIPPVGTRVAAFSGYHWKIKSVNPETQEIVLEHDNLTTQGTAAKGAMFAQPISR